MKGRGWKGYRVKLISLQLNLFSNGTSIVIVRKLVLFKETLGMLLRWVSSDLEQSGGITGEEHLALGSLPF